MTRIALALLAALYALPAAAQVNLNSVCSNCIVGRLGGTVAGPVQAIPFTRLGLVPTTAPVLGLAGTISGSIGLVGITSGKVTLSVQNAAGTWTLKFPTTAGSNGQALITDGSGNTSWAAGTGTVNSGTAGQIGYYASTAAAISGNSQLSISGATLTVGQAGAAGQVNYAGGTSGSTILQANAIASGTLTLPAATDTLIGKATTDTLTNKTYDTAGSGNVFKINGTGITAVTGTGAVALATSAGLTTPAITGGTAAALTGLAIRSTGAAFDLTFATSEVLTAGRTLSFIVNDGARILNLSGNLITSGGNALTLTTTGATNSTFPLGTQTLAGLGVAQTFSALNQFTNLKLSTGLIYPVSDSTTALGFGRANGSTYVMTVDTTNTRVGINKTPGAFDLDVNGAANVGSTLTFLTLDPTSLGNSTSTVTGLTANNAPNASNDYIPYYNAADGKIRKATVGSIAAGATAGVSSLNGLTGGLSVVAGTGIGVAAAGSSVTVSIAHPTFTNSLASDASLAVAGTYVTAATTPQGTSGTWLAVGGATVNLGTAGDNIYCRLTDGTTVADSGAALGGTATINQRQRIPLSGVFIAPAANIKIECVDANTGGTSAIKANQSGQVSTRDSTLTVVRLQ